MGLLVIDAGLRTTVQDLGRPGYRQWGVPPGGTFDRRSAGLANALVGNPPDCAVLELTLWGGVYQADCPLAIALAGAPIQARVISSDSRERKIEPPLSCSLGVGESPGPRPDPRWSPSVSGGQRRVANQPDPGQPIVGSADRLRDGHSG